MVKPIDEAIEALPAPIATIMIHRAAAGNYDGIDRVAAQKGFAHFREVMVGNFALREDPYNRTWGPGLSFRIILSIRLRWEAFRGASL